MGAAIFTSGPYIEMSISPLTPMTPSVEDGVVTWRVPLGQGAVSHVALDDCGFYVRWLFDHPRLANGMNLETAIADITYTELASAFEKVTGHPAQFIDIDLETYWSGPLNGVADQPAGYNADPNDKSTMSFRDNFTGFWNMWKHRIITRDYALLDEIHPNRIRTAEEWFRREDKLGQELGKGSLWERVQPENWTLDSSILKGSADMRRGGL
jgi:NmrA-like family protein